MRAADVNDLVIFGTGQIAQVVHYYVGHESGRRVAGFAVDGSYLREDKHLGLPVVAFEDVCAAFPPDRFDMFVAMSFKEFNAPRVRKTAQAQALGYALASHVSPRAHVWSGFTLHPNTVIMEGCIVEPYVTVGKNVILWAGSHVAHHSSIADHCFIAPGATICGSVAVGERTFVGANATIRDNVTVGKRSVIGAGSLILHDTSDDAIVRGNHS